MRRATLALLTLAIAAGAAPTHLVGTFRTVAGVPLDGSLIFTWQSILTGNVLYRAGSLVFPIRAGLLDIAIEPGYYDTSWGGPNGAEHASIYVPPSRTPVDISACQLTDARKLPATNIAASGATAAGQVLTWNGAQWQPMAAGEVAGPYPISAIIGLQAALTAEAAARAAAIAAISLTPGPAGAAGATGPTGATGAPGSGAATYTASFTNALVVTIPGATHALGSADLRVTCYDATGEQYAAGVAINQSTYDVTITHAVPEAGHCVLSH